MIGTVEDRAGQVVETGVQEIEPVLALPLDRADFGYQKAALGHKIAARLDLEADGVAEAIFQPLAGSVPEGEIGRQIDVRVALAISRRQAAAGADRRTAGPTARAAFSIAAQTCERCARSVPEPICM